MIAGPTGDPAGGRDDLIARIETAVRNLVALAGGPDGEYPVGPPEVLLDVRVDDVRCRLETAVESTSASRSGPLSPRETEVARMVAQGYPNKTIAAMLEISSFTVSSYLRRIFAKLNVNSRAAMVARLLENRLLR